MTLHMFLETLHNALLLCLLLLQVLANKICWPRACEQGVVAVVWW